MNLTPSKLKELCNKYGLSPSKAYGQNYLITDAPIKKMIKAADLKKTDTVIEIGPGFGVLTFALVEKVKKVMAFEIERRLEGYWNEIIETEKFRNLEIVWGNALKQLKSYKVKSYKVLANIPYQITSDLLRTLLELENKPESITLMVQKEVAQRICAKPSNMSLLAVSVQYYGEPKIIDLVPRGCFWPSPKVDSAILRITLAPEHLSIRAPKHPSTLAPKHLSTRAPDNENTENTKTQKTRRHENTEESERFFKIVKAGFSHKRKQLWSNLAKQLKVESFKVKSVIAEVMGNEKVRAEEVSVEQWKEIVNSLVINNYSN